MFQSLVGMENTSALTSSQQGPVGSLGLGIGDWIALATLVIVILGAPGAISFLITWYRRPRLGLDPEFAVSAETLSGAKPKFVQFFIQVANVGKLKLGNVVARVKIILPADCYFLDSTSGAVVGMVLGGSSPFLHHQQLHWRTFGNGNLVSNVVDLEPEPYGLPTFLDVLKLEREGANMRILSDTSSESEANELFPAGLREGPPDFFEGHREYRFGYRDGNVQTPDLRIEVRLFIRGTYAGGEVSKNTHYILEFPGIGGTSFDLSRRTLTTGKG